MGSPAENPPRTAFSVSALNSPACRPRAAGAGIGDGAHTVRRSAPAAAPPGLEFYAGLFPRYNRILAEHGFAADAVVIAEAWARGDRAAVEHAVSDALIDTTSIAGTASNATSGSGIPRARTGFADPRPLRPRPGLPRLLRGRLRRQVTG
jgi:hypothetical protein